MKPYRLKVISVAVVFGGILLYFSSPAGGQEVRSLSTPDSMDVFRDLFERVEPLHVTLKFDFRAFQRTKQRENYHDAEMTTIASDTFRLTHPVRVRTRGNFRQDYCFNPPFFLNIKRSGIETGDELDEHQRIKVVVPCRSTDIFDDYVLKEYLVYRLYNIVTPYSFRVRLVRLTIIDTGRDNEVTEEWAFLIEPEELLAARNSGREITSDKLSLRTMNPEMMDILGQFQYMIGNGDYSVTGRHNLKIIAVAAPGPVGFLPVPYDFDYTGLVNTDYAVPGEDLGIRTVRERYFLGACRSQEKYLEAINYMQACRDEMIGLINDFEYLKDELKTEMVDYLQEYFDAVQRDSFMPRELDSTCR